MQFNPSTEYDSIVKSARDYVGASSTDFPVNKIVRYANIAVDMCTGWILEADDRFEWDDPNHPDQPVITLDLESGKRDYTVWKDENDYEILKLRKVLIKDRNGNYKPLDPIDATDTSSYTEGPTRTGEPSGYDKMGVQVLLDAVPDYSQADGFKAYVQRSAQKFTPSDTTKEPGFASAFHYIVPLICGFLYAREKGLAVKADLKNDLYGEGDEMQGGAKGKLQLYYSTRSADENASVSGFSHDPR